MKHLGSEIGFLTLTRHSADLFKRQKRKVDKLLTVIEIGPRMTLEVGLSDPRGVLLHFKKTARAKRESFYLEPSERKVIAPNIAVIFRKGNASRATLTIEAPMNTSVNRADKKR